MVAMVAKMNSIQNHSIQDIWKLDWGNVYSNTGHVEPFIRMASSASIYMTVLMTFERFFAICLSGIHCIFKVSRFLA